MDIDIDLESVSSHHSMSRSMAATDANLHRIKRLCIREQDSADYSDSFSEVVNVGGFAPDVPISFASDRTSSDSTACFQPQSHGCVLTSQLPSSIDLSTHRRRNLKRPRSSISTDATTAGSANTFFNSFHSDEVAVPGNDHTFNRKEGFVETYPAPALNRLRNLRGNDKEREISGFFSDGHGEGRDQANLKNNEDHKERNEPSNREYQSFNTMLGSLHLERERRARELRLELQSKPVLGMNSNSGSVSSLTSFSTATGNDLDFKRGARSKMPKQVHLQSHSNLS